MPRVLLIFFHSQLVMVSRIWIYVVAVKHHISIPSPLPHLHPSPLHTFVTLHSLPHLPYLPWCLHLILFLHNSTHSSPLLSLSPFLSSSLLSLFSHFSPPLPLFPPPLPHFPPLPLFLLFPLSSLLLSLLPSFSPSLPSSSPLFPPPLPHFTPSLPSSSPSFSPSLPSFSPSLPSFSPSLPSQINSSSCRRTR